MTFNSSRKFGIEIEANLSLSIADQFRPGAYHRGNSIPNAPVTANGGQWTSQSDSSISNSDNQSLFGAEIVSPPLQGEEGLIDLLAMLDYVKEAGVRFNGSTGIHIHIESGDLTDAQAQAFVEGFIRYERGFFALNGAQALRRWDNHYCPHSGHWVTRDVTFRDYNSRYQALNWQRHSTGSERSTIEFRLFAGNLAECPEALITAIMLAVSFADMIKAGTLPTVNTQNMLPSTVLASLLTSTGLTDDDEIREELLPTVLAEAQKADALMI